MRYAMILLVLVSVSACRSAESKFEVIAPPDILASEQDKPKSAADENKSTAKDAKDANTDKEKPLTILDAIKKMDEEAMTQEQLAPKQENDPLLRRLNAKTLGNAIQQTPRIRPFGIVDNMELSIGWGKVPRQVATMTSPKREIVTESSNYWRQLSLFPLRVKSFNDLRIFLRYNGNGANFSTKAGYRGNVSTDAGGVTMLQGSGDGSTYIQNKLAFDYGVRKDTGHDSSKKAADYTVVEKTPRLAGEFIQTRIQPGKISMIQFWVRGERAPPGERTSSILSKGKRVSLATTDHAVDRSNIDFGALAEFYQTRYQRMTIAASLEAGEVREEKALNGIFTLRFRFFGHMDIAGYYRRVEGGDHSTGAWCDISMYEF